MVLVIIVNSSAQSEGFVPVQILTPFNFIGL